MKYTIGFIFGKIFVTTLFVYPIIDGYFNIKNGKPFINDLILLFIVSIWKRLLNIDSGLMIVLKELFQKLERLENKNN